MRLVVTNPAALVRHEEAFFAVVLLAEVPVTYKRGATVILRI